MKKIADEYPDPDKAKYQSAANRFMLPFWDPLMPRNNVVPNALLQSTTIDVDETIWGLPKILAAKYVWVIRPTGTKLEPINNPLYQFNIPSDEVLKNKGRVPVVWPSITKAEAEAGPYEEGAVKVVSVTR